MNEDIERLENFIDGMVNARVFGSKQQAVEYIIDVLEQLEKNFIEQQMQEVDA